MFRWIALAVALLTATSCSNRVEEQAELIRVVLVTHNPQPIIVLSPDLPAATQQAARSVGVTISQASVPASKQWRLPPGYFVQESVEINRAGAVVAGLFGPVPAPPKPGVGLLSCGSHVRVQFQRVRGSWRQGETEQIVC